ncbi:MAG TPA: nicotinate-nucleotide--dimethylbenzimidazole phosphoribosyltransferase [Methylibium sp.]|uniref:nicotinate-nucleotide--dimethylbenzimidazole phosphoribosyltransferase n=1 Tax=Methylibium sp. TaxID=2067992 RepID=UPI002DC021BF|nr:nicotinate-nucleotide--dimethylbenzimidazole phosphoribosyltransferase [Methylibium sp.]HEU4459899.1 nicotinate-nucleotide--dimethylbenzimidazole phosphoribosyltransferase [Methylibium sp.]
MSYDWTAPAIEPSADAALAARLRQRIDHLTKPLGALGRIEALMLQLGLLQRSERPRLEAPQALVFAADHGLAAQGVSAYPAEVTAQMVANFMAGGAAISVLARQHAMALTIVDAGVRSPIPGLLGEGALQGAAAPSSARPRFVSAPVAAGTADALLGAAMSHAQCVQALELGRATVSGLPGNALVLGEMGIGNTSAAALLTARLTGAPLARCIGRGTGLDDAALERKRAVLERVAERHAEARAPLEALAAFGGFEIAALAGALLQAAHERRLVVVDGFIVTAALLVAHALRPAVLDACVFAHCSDEAGHRGALDHLRAEPLLALGLRLGEGSGAALAWPIVASAVALLDGMASFQAAGVSTAASSHPAGVSTAASSHSAGVDTAASPHGAGVGSTPT